MKKLFILCSAIFLCAVVYGNAFSAPVVSLGNLEALPGETITFGVELSGSSGSGIDGFSFRVLAELNSGALTGSTPVAGSALPAGFAFAGQVKPADNRFDFFYSVFSPNPPDISDGTLATFTLTVDNGVAPGSVFALEFADVVFSDKGVKVDVDSTDGSLAVVPIPSAILLLGGGLIGLIAVRRRRS